MPAMLVLVLGALLAARIANLRTELTGAFRKLRPPSHLASSKRADIGAAPVEFDAAGHHRDVVLMQTRRGAVFARGEAIVACLDAALVSFV